MFSEFVDKRDLGKKADMLHEVTTQHSRYSIEVNYRTELDEVFDAFAKLVLGYVSAAIKACGYHCKQVFSTKPYRCLVSTRDWDDGEWVAFAVWNHKERCFVVGEGSYNKDKKTVTIHRSKRTDHKCASEVVKALRNLMEKLKRQDPVRIDSLRPVKMKKGPKPVKIKKKL
jgi:hypothetical protein